jgi:hypothetical protein
MCEVQDSEKKRYYPGYLREPQTQAEAGIVRRKQQTGNSEKDEKLQIEGVYIGENCWSGFA